MHADVCYTMILGFNFSHYTFVQVVNVTGLSVVVGLMSAADTLCPQVLSCISIETVHIIIMLYCRPMDSRIIQGLESFYSEVHLRWMV